MAAVTDRKTELLALLVAAFGAPNVKYAEPASLPESYELVFIAGNPGYVRGGGEQYRTEAFALSVGIDLFKPGDDPQAADIRRWQMIDTLDAALMSADFGGYNTEGGTLTERESQLTGYENGWRAQSILDISVEERI